MKKIVKLNLLLVLALLLGVAAYWFPQPVAAQTGSFDFIFTSTPNPSAYTQKVTFSLFTRVWGEIELPHGTVEFLDDGETIPGCEMVYLNDDGDGSIRDIPAVCETSTLVVGDHTITAIFVSYPNYENATFTLGQKVNELIPLTITPETLLDGEYGMKVDQYFTAAYSDFSVCADCLWDYSGDLPDSVGGAYTEGWIMGQVDEVGTFTFTVTAANGEGAFGSREYTWTIQKSTPEVTVRDKLISSSYGGALIFADVSHASNSQIIPPGTMSFSLGEEPIDGCTEAPTNQEGRAECNAIFDPPLDPGYYPVAVEFTPDESVSEYYNNGSGSGTLTVARNVNVQLFNDRDRDGVRDPDTESPPGGWWRIYLDRGCDGSNEYWDVIMDGSGYLSFPAILPGDQYCLSIDLGEYWRQSTPLEPFTMGLEDKYFEIGVYVPHLEFDPTELPQGTVGEAYYQEITITGGVELYIITDLDCSVPDGLTFDPETFTLSGTPTAVGVGFLSFEVQDAEGLTGYWSSMVEILTYGSYDLTTNPTPSVSGQAVTFTFTGTGDVVDPDDGPIPPYGDVTFFDGDTVIAGCEALPLNYDPDKYEWIDQPAVCTTSGLAEGLHEIRAEFESFGTNHDKVLTLNHLVEASSNPATSIFLPIVMHP